MDTPSFKEDHISQVPALQLLQNMGYTYLTPEEALHMRGGKTSNVILEEVLRRQLREINSIQVSASRTSIFSNENIERGIMALKDLPLHEGYMAACETAYYLLTLGKPLEQSIDGDKKSFTLQYIDWKNPTRNVFHVTEEYSVMRSSGREHYVPDIVLFVNGIPLCIIECKRPDSKDPLRQAISQHLRNQQEDGIRHLYAYSQVVLSIATQEAQYATNATEENFWSIWREKFASSEEETDYPTLLGSLKNTPLTPEQKDKLFAARFRYVRFYFDHMERQRVLPTEQDKYLYSLCRPERLLDLTFNFVLFEDGEKKIARYQQYFVIKKTMQRLLTFQEGKRTGGVIWHTQGSGKSLTMVMLAQAIALEPSIRNPKIILVTDRTDLDTQITDTFMKCGMMVHNATTGQKLVELLESAGDAVVTTVINKFSAAVKKINPSLTSPDIFVLVDEGHRTQHGTFNLDMQKTLPNACFIAMTGTPLFKKDKSTAERFGGIIDQYPMDVAVADKAVVPLLYEGRVARQEVNAAPLDTFFNMIAEPLTEYQKKDLKKKFSRADQLNAAEQKIYAIAWDISLHFRDSWQDTPFKGQLVCDKKTSAIKFKNFLDEIGIVSSEVLISSPDEREGEDSAYEKSNVIENRFWKKMMEEHRTPAKYQANIINRFKHQKEPEIIIVVDKLLTGFDEPKNTVLYLTRNLREHKLLQAIARVNRNYSGKSHGYIIDYYGVIGELDIALDIYSSLQEFDEDDLAGTLTSINEEIRKLPQKHSELWDIFKSIPNRRDAEAYQVLLRDDEKRILFYDKLTAFATALKLALSSSQFHKNENESIIQRYKDDLAMFLKLRSAAMTRYSDRIDYGQYEAQIQKLIDTHVTSGKVEIITELVDIFDKEKFEQELEKVTGAAARADTIASRTAKHIAEKMEEDPVLYKKFSELLKDAIREYEARRIDEAQYLQRVQEICHNVLNRTDNEIPAILRDKDAAKAFFGLCFEGLADKMEDTALVRDIAAGSALAIDDIIQEAIMDQGTPIIDWEHKTNITGKLLIDIGDYLIDEVRDKYDIDISFDTLDDIAAKCIQVAKKRYKP